jgi:hypothetical protein
MKKLIAILAVILCLITPVWAAETNVTPTQSGNNSPDVNKVTSADSENGAAAAWKAADQTADGGWASTTVPSVETPSWWRYDCHNDTGGGKYFTAFAITTTSDGNHVRGPQDFKIQGSNNGSTWTDLSTVTGEAAWGTSETRKYNFANTTKYGYIQIVVTKGRSDYEQQYEEITLYETIPSGWGGTIMQKSPAAVMKQPVGNINKVIGK